MRKIFTLIFFIFLGVLIFTPVFARENSPAGENKLEINFFYSEICPHCRAEQNFLDKIEPKYPDVKINRHPVSQVQCQEELVDLCKKYGIEKYVGLVPITFVGEEFFLGFDNENGIGKQIEESIQRQLNNQNQTPENKNKITLPIIGEIDISKYSLPVLTVILGALDGFNVCSLGALILILGLILALRSRKKILIFGGIFILTTAIIYGILIVLWYQLFSLLAPYERLMTVLIGILGIGGGIYFLKEFIKFRKYGPMCDTGQGAVASKFSSKIQKTLTEKSAGILAIIMSILLFATIITIIEFPCSAVVPVVFAGVLAKAQLSPLVYFFYIAFYVLFYMLDEILVFLIAVFTMKLWLASPKFVTWITLVEAIILFLLGFYYLTGF